jgi:hypothetical protein
MKPRAWLTIAGGTLYVLATFRLAFSRSSGSVWFYGSSMANPLVGALNLLHRTSSLPSDLENSSSKKLNYPEKNPI